MKLPVVTRPHRHSFLSFSLACLLAVPFVASSARAQADQSASTQARTTFEAGVEASRGQHWDEARAQFERSLALVPKPSTMFNLALAYIKLGMGREALAQLDAFEQAAVPDEHAAMLSRAQVMRPQAQALVDSAQAKAQSGGNVLSQSEDGLNDEVRREVAEARANYQRGRDKQALSGFERAYRESKRPELLYNIGVVADRLRNDKRAISAYDAFVEALPDAREAAVAQVRSEALRVALERERDERERPNIARGPLREQTSTPPDLHRPRVLLVTGSLVSAVALGTLFGAVASQAKRGDKWDKCIDLGAPDCRNLDGVRTSKNLAKVGIIASPLVLATGIVLTVTGAVQLVRRKHERAESRFALLPTFSQHGGMLTAVGAF